SDKGRFTSHPVPHPPNAKNRRVRGSMILGRYFLLLFGVMAASAAPSLAADAPVSLKALMDEGFFNARFTPPDINQDPVEARSATFQNSLDTSHITFNSITNVVWMQDSVGTFNSDDNGSTLHNNDTPYHAQWTISGMERSWWHGFAFTPLQG